MKRSPFACTECGNLPGHQCCVVQYTLLFSVCVFSPAHRNLTVGPQALAAFSALAAASVTNSSTGANGTYEWGVNQEAIIRSTRMKSPDDGVPPGSDAPVFMETSVTVLGAWDRPTLLDLGGVNDVVAVSIKQEVVVSAVGPVLYFRPPCQQCKCQLDWHLLKHLMLQTKHDSMLGVGF